MITAFIEAYVASLAEEDQWLHRPQLGKVPVDAVTIRGLLPQTRPPALSTADPAGQDVFSPREQDLQQTLEGDARSFLAGDLRSEVMAIYERAAASLRATKPGMDSPSGKGPWPLPRALGKTVAR